MPDPREAIYDVLLAKKQRAEEERRRQERRVGEYQTRVQAWAEYEEENARAASADRARKKWMR